MSLASRVLSQDRRIFDFRLQTPDFRLSGVERHAAPGEAQKKRPSRPRGGAAEADHLTGRWTRPHRPGPFPKANAETLKS